LLSIRVTILTYYAKPDNQSYKSPPSAARLSPEPLKEAGWRAKLRAAKEILLMPLDSCRAIGRSLGAPEAEVYEGEDF